MDPKKLAEILTKASREANQKNMTAQQKLHKNIAVAKAAARIEDAAAQMLLSIDGEGRATARRTSDGIGSAISNGNTFNV